MLCDLTAREHISNYRQLLSVIHRGCFEVDATQNSWNRDSSEVLALCQMKKDFRSFPAQSAYPAYEPYGLCR